MGSTVGDTAGAITVSNTGDIGIYFISDRMAWAYKKGDGSIIAGIDSPDPWRKINKKNLEYISIFLKHKNS